LVETSSVHSCCCFGGTTFAENGAHPAIDVAALAPPQAVRQIFDRYLSARTKLNKNDSTLRGVGRHVVVAETDGQALAIARRTYPRWRANFFWLFERHGSAPRVANLYPKTFDEVMDLGTAVAGSPQTVADFVASDIEGHWGKLLNALGSPSAT
jgi:alkanesulfonate monooxygenase SsuD/methylene tetrahydromethanopterin reductase-like flavin-dependent oxidoreductase (luciferase family)